MEWNFGERSKIKYLEMHSQTQKYASYCVPELTVGMPYNKDTKF